jgi:dihydrofolate reductase
MTKVVAGITTSLDGYITGPNDGPGNGLGDGGERLHYWVFGGPWSYAEDPKGEATGVDKAYLDEGAARNGAVVGGRGTYEAADHWGGRNPWSIPFFIVTHRPEDEPEGAGFTFVGSLDDAVSRARSVAGDKNVAIMGGADTIRQGLRDGYVEELTITTAPVILGGGKRLFEGFTESLDLEPLEVRSSPLATHVTYRVKR